MKRNTTVREYVPVGRVSWLVIALVGMVAAWMLFHYQAPGIITFIVVQLAVLHAVLGFVLLPPGPAYSFASKTGGRDAAGRPVPRRGEGYNPPVSRVRLALYAALLGALAGLAYWLDAPSELFAALVLCAALQAATLLLPDRLLRLLAWDMNL